MLQSIYLQTKSQAVWFTQVASWKSLFYLLFIQENKGFLWCHDEKKQHICLGHSTFVSSCKTGSWDVEVCSGEIR